MTHDIHVLEMWIRVVEIIAAVATTSFPVIYSLYPWRSRPIGRVLMGVGVTYAVTLDTTTFMSFWRPKNILLIFWVDAILLTAIAVSTSCLTYYVWKINRPRRRKIDIMQLSSKAYDVTKKIAQIYIPALATLYFAIAQIWHLPETEEVIGTLAAVDTFLGAILHVSATSYLNDPNRLAGTLRLEPGEDGTNLHISSLDSQKLLTQPEVTFKMVGSSTQ